MNVVRIALCAMLAVLSLGCGDSSSGAGGSGGTVPRPELRFAHLAPDVPSAEDTALDLLIDGETVLSDVQFGHAEPFFLLEAGEHELAIAEAGRTAPLYSIPLELVDGDVLTVVAYRVSAAESSLDVFLLDGNLEGLPSGQGRVIVAHGADERVLSVVDLIIAAADACPPPLISNLEFAEQVQLIPDLDASTFPLAIAAPDGACVPVLPPLVATVLPDVANFWILIDTDTSESLRPAVYVLDAETSGQIPDMDPVTQ